MNLLTCLVRLAQLQHENVWRCKMLCKQRPPNTPLMGVHNSNSWHAICNCQQRVGSVPPMWRT